MEPFDTPPFRECAVLIKADDCRQILRCFANFGDAQNICEEFVRRDCGRRKRNVNLDGSIHLDESLHALVISFVFYGRAILPLKFMGVTFMKFAKNLDWTVATISYQIIVGGIIAPPVCKYNPVVIFILAHLKDC